MNSSVLLQARLRFELYGNGAWDASCKCEAVYHLLAKPTAAALRHGLAGTFTPVLDRADRVAGLKRS